MPQEETFSDLLASVEVEEEELRARRTRGPEVNARAAFD